MKLFALLVTFLVGTCATTQPGWEPSKEYRFLYSGRLLNGLPELNNHFSGLGVNATVSLKVKAPNQFYLTVEDAKFVAINQELQAQESRSLDEGNNWRQLRLPQMTPVPEEKAAVLKLPITFTMGESGAFQNLKVEQKDTLWSKNFKKALVNLFQVKVQARSPSQWENMIESPIPEQQPFWTVKEQSIMGQCETTYKVNLLPKYLIRQDPSLVPNPVACQGQEFFEIIRTINFDKCDRFASYQFFGTGQFPKCSADTMTNCDNFWGRSSSIRTIACGSRSSGKLSVQTIINDGEMNTILLGHKTENFVTGTRQNLTLLEVNPTSSYPEIEQPLQLDSLLYEHAESPNHEHQIMSDDLTLSRKPRSSQDPKSIAQSYPPNFMSGVREGKSGKSTNDAGEKILNILRNMAKDIHGASGTRLSESQIGLKLLTAARGFTMLHTADEILKLYGGIEASGEEVTESVRQIFLDACAISGTPQAIQFFEKAFKAGKIREKEMIHFFLWLPHYVIVPNEKVLNGIFNTITSDVIKSKPTMYNIAITGFTQLVQQACVEPQGLMQYPTWVFGEFCNPESSIVQEVLIPYLSKESRKTGVSENHKNIHIVSLGLLSHKNVIGELTPLIENSKGQDADLRRIMALYSLSYVGRYEPNLVQPILQTLFTNPAESTEVRIVAFNSLIKLNPPTHVFNTIAHTTHQETNMNYELLKTINIAFYTLGNSAKSSNLPNEHIQLVQKCKDAYAIVKKTYGITPTSGNYYRTEFLKDFEVGYHGLLGWMSSQESILPKIIYLKLKLFMETVDMDAFESGYRLTGVESLYEHVIDSLNGQSGSFMEQIRQGLSSEWKSVIGKLKLEKRESSGFKLFFLARAFGSGIFLKTFTDSATNSIKDKIVELIRTPSLSSMNGENKINIQKSFVLNPYIMVVPSEMGFPIDLEIYTPTTVSLTGKVNFNSEKSKPSISVETKVLLSAQITGWVGTTVPFTEKYSLTGMDQHLLYHLPGSMKLDLNIPDQKASVTIKPGQDSRSGEIDLWHYHVMPYTVLERIDSLIPHTKSQNWKLIRSTSPQKTGQYRFGQNLGLSLNAEYKSESAFTDLRSIFETARMFNYSPLNVGLFQYVTPAFNGQMKPSTRLQKYTVTVNPAESSTKEIQVEFKVGCASKHENMEAKYHSIETVSESERLSGREARESVEGAASSISSFVKKVLPYRVKSESINSTSQHNARVQKLKQAMEGLGTTRSAHALSITTNIVLKGNRPKTYSYSLAFARGQQPKETKMVEQKWNLHLDSSDRSETSVPKKVCLNGKLDMPLLPMWNLNNVRTSLAEFYYENKLKFGWQSCSESTIFTKGVARVSHKQQSHALETPEARKCLKLSQEQRQGSQLSQVCEEARDQASTLDEIEFTSDFKNVPKFVSMVEKRSVDILKVYLWPYHSFKASSTHGSDSYRKSFQTKTLVAFKQTTPSFDLTIRRPQEVVTFANIHVSEPYSIFLPLKGSMSAMSVIRKISDSAFYPKCKVDSNTITSYDNQTIPFKTDKCFHLLTADCSKYKRFGVSVRSQEGEKKELKIYLKDSVVVMTPSGSEGPKVTVDGQPFEVRTNQVAKISRHSYTLATLTRSVDGVVVLNAPAVYLEELAFNGKLVSVVPSPMLKNKLCGLCGDHNQDKSGDFAGPNKCLYSRPELNVASYRIPSDSCPPMSSHVKGELRKETDQCSKYQVKPTKVAKAFKINTGKCTLLRHVIMQQPKQVCFSKELVTQCGPSCKVNPSEVVEKTVQFVCLPRGHIADLIIKKIREGKPVDELNNKPTSFNIKMKQPRHCVHALVSGSTPTF